MDFEAAILDLDGTLLNSMEVWEHIDISLLQKRGLSVPTNYVTEICSRSFEEAAQYSAVWKESGDGDCQIVMNHIHNILEKIEDDPARSAYIQTVWGVGYRFCGENISNGLKHG